MIVKDFLEIQSLPTHTLFVKHALTPCTQKQTKKINVASSTHKKSWTGGLGAARTQAAHPLTIASEVSGNSAGARTHTHTHKQIEAGVGGQKKKNNNNRSTGLGHNGSQCCCYN